MWTIKIKFYKQLFSNASVGSTIFFGSYEQDNNKSNGKEDIEWIVLAQNGTNVLVISKYALDCQPYNTKNTDTTWEKSSLRKWLNETFMENGINGVINDVINNISNNEKIIEFITDISSNFGTNYGTTADINNLDYSTLY